MSSLIEKLKTGEHTTKINGKDFVLFSGLLVLSHEAGLKSLESSLISIDHDRHSAVFKTTATGARGTFVGHGDADPTNLSKMMLPSYIRMAETRSICRALRFYLGIGMCAKDELPDQNSAQPIVLISPERCSQDDWRSIIDACESRKMPLEVFDRMILQRHKDGTLQGHSLDTLTPRDASIVLDGFNGGE
jgi:hypothetical protein